MKLLKIIITFVVHRSSPQQKTVAEMSERELLQLRSRLYNHKRKYDDPRLDIQLHAVHGELKDRGHVNKNSRR